MKALWILAAAALAGCAAAPEPAPVPEPPAAPVAAAPAWSIGQWWNYTLSDGTSSTRVVAADLGADWQVAASDAGSAFWDALTDVSSMGPVRKGDLAGSQGPMRVTFFRFPLTDGDTWMTPWDGIDVTVTARAQPDGRFTFTGTRADGTVHAEYDFDPAALWATAWTFYGNGTEPMFTMRLASHGTNYTGDLARWDLETIVEEEGAIPPGSQTQTFAVSPSATDVWVRHHLACTAGAVALSVGPVPDAPNDARGLSVGPAPCPLTSEGEGPVGAPVASPAGGAETWSWQIHAPPSTTGDQDLHVIVRTLHREPFA